jgi:hypothetical protein
MGFKIDAKAVRDRIAGANPFLEAIFDELGELRPRRRHARRVAKRRRLRRRGEDQHQQPAGNCNHPRKT